MTGRARTDARGDAWLALALLEGASPRRVLELVRRCGGPDAVFAAPGLRPELVAALARARGRVASERAALGRAGATLLTLDDEAYPARLRDIADPPLALWVRGTLVPADALAVAVVGARRAGEYGRRVADELARGLAGAGVTVVSGLAAGIDAAAHRGALAAGGRTVAVMATGIDRVFPVSHWPLAREVAAQGAVVTEFPCGTSGLRFHFPRRNRIISALTVGTVVVEAAGRSGALITAEYALEQGREVFAVPGPVGTPAHVGCHRLIQQGAKLVTRSEDVLEEIAPRLVSRLQAARAQAEQEGLTAVERTVLDALGDEPAHVDPIATRAGLPPASVLETLLALELRGLVEQLPGMRHRRRRVA